jgi:hypothetical protein
MMSVRTHRAVSYLVQYSIGFPFGFSPPALVPGLFNMDYEWCSVLGQPWRPPLIPFSANAALPPGMIHPTPLHPQWRVPSAELAIRSGLWVESITNFH